MTRRGFTFVELVLVTVVLGILLAATVPRFAATAERLRLEHTAFELLQLFRTARARAVNEGLTVVWVWHAAERRVELERHDPASGTITVLTERETRSAALPPGTTLTITQGGQRVACDCVAFGPDGRVETLAVEPLQVDMGYRGTRYHIELDAQTSRTVLSAGPAAG